MLTYTVIYRFWESVLSQCNIIILLYSYELVLYIICNGTCQIKMDRIDKTRQDLFLVVI